MTMTGTAAIRQTIAGNDIHLSKKFVMQKQNRRANENGGGCAIMHTSQKAKGSYQAAGPGPNIAVQDIDSQLIRLPPISL